jgi:hypothetical protein
MKRDYFDLERAHRVDDLWTIFSLAVAIGGALLLGSYFWQAERRYDECMQKAGRDYWKQQECRNGQAPAR